VLVVIHDDSVDRTTNGSGRVKEMPLAEIKALDAGDYWTSDGGLTYPFRGQGITIPTLEEILQAFPGKPMNIEIKQADPPIGGVFCDLLRQYDMTGRVLVASFNQSAMDDFRAVCPEVSTSATEAEVRTLFYYHLALGTVFYRPPAGINAVQVPEERSGFHILTPRFVAGAHSKGLEVHAWTINDLAAMQRDLDLGVDGVITDYPDRLLSLLTP
jgi:glycerophosphoryl diester phosphodiesterase